MEPQRQWTGTTLGAMVWDLFSSAPIGSYVFRNRFDLKSNGRFNFEAEKHILSPGGGNEYVVITAPKSDMRIKDCDNLILWGGPYPDLESALTGARKWRQIAIAVFPRLALGCDFGDDDEDKLQPRVIDEYGGVDLAFLGPDEEGGIELRVVGPEARYSSTSCGWRWRRY
jgi:hypothetical protein